MCKLCETKPVYEFTNKRKLCKTCYIRWFEKKFFYVMRKLDLDFKDSETLSYLNLDDFKGVVLEKMLSTWIEKRNLKLNKIKNLKETKNKKIALPTTSDDITSDFIHELFDSEVKIKEFLPIQKVNNKTFFLPLHLFLDKEVKLYAELTDLEFKKVNQRKTKLDVFIDELYRLHPELKTSVVSSINKLKRE